MARLQMADSVGSCGTTHLHDSLVGFISCLQKRCRWLVPACSADSHNSSCDIGLPALYKFKVSANIQYAVVDNANLETMFPGNESRSIKKQLTKKRRKLPHTLCSWPHGLLDTSPTNGHASRSACEEVSSPATSL
jgi:hypothetical protein